MTHKQWGKRTRIHTYASMSVGANLDASWLLAVDWSVAAPGGGQKVPGLADVIALPEPFIAYRAQTRLNWPLVVFHNSWHVSPQGLIICISERAQFFL